MTGINYTFDANQHKPQQGIGSHPVGKFPFTISNTSCDATKDNTGGMFVVEFTTPAGQIVTRYNLWNNSPKAVEIAHGQLSALCHATGIFRLDFNNEGAALRNARGMIEVGYQKGEEPTPEKPAGGYVEVKKVFDERGEEPGRAPAGAPQVQPPAPAAPMQQGGNGSWGAPSASQPQNPTPAPAWSNPSQPQPNANPLAAPWGGASQQPGQSANWQQGQPTQTPPWGSR